MTIIGHHKATSSSLKLPCPITLHFCKLHWSCKHWNNSMGINEIIQCICHYASTLRCFMKDNLPPWNLWFIPKKHLLNLWSKHKRFIKFMQWMLKINKQKAHIISFVSRFAFIVNPIFHPFTTKQHNQWRHWHGPYSNSKICFKIPTYWITPNTSSSFPCDY